MNDMILKFVEKRPEVVAAYGYGSGVFKQAGYTSKDKPQIDMIFVVDDMKKWHKENMKLNKKDYSFFGRIVFRFFNVKGRTGIAYLSNIKEDGSVFKYGTIELKDFEKNFDTWKSFYIPGRFQKNVYPIVENDKIKKLIDKNRDNALLVSTFLQRKEEVSKKDILVTLCGLSYLGDTRMKHFEDPRKVLNIVEGSFDSFDKIYKFDRDYLKPKGEDFIIDKKRTRIEINDLPDELVEYIFAYLDKDDEIVQAKIEEYFTKINKKESTAQTIKGFFTTGPIRSINYAYQKAKKGMKK